MVIYEYNEEELNIISSYDKTSYKFWNENKVILSPLRKNLREHYLPQQKFRCCYCKMLKQEMHGLTWDVEHIAPKSLYPQFMFENFNLCISCKECNIAKLESDVFRETRRLREYPNDPLIYSIIHPHFDIYSDHLEVKIHPNGHITHRAKTQKGKETYICCNLFRFSSDSCGYNADADLVLKFSSLVDSINPLSAESAKALLVASLPQILPAEELNC